MLPIVDRRIAAVTVGAAVAACSLAIDTNELVSGEDGGHTDASAMNDVGADGPKTDGQAPDITLDAPFDVPVEVGLDGPDAADAPEVGGPFCSTLSPAPTLCSDFDQANLPAGWSSLSQWGSASGTLDSAESKSAPRSLLFVTPALAQSTDQAAAYLLGSFPKPTTELRIELDLFPQTIGDEWIHLIVIEMQGPTEPSKPCSG
jgi:hypothetical protein